MALQVCFGPSIGFFNGVISLDANQLGIAVWVASSVFDSGLKRI
jgi:hypothetical protein